MTEAIPPCREAAPPPCPWAAAYPADVDWAAPIPARPLFAHFDDAVAAFHDRPCLEFLGRTWTYGEVGRLVDRAAKGFQQQGVGKGTKVGLCLPNTPYYVVCYYAVLKAGGTVVNYNPLYVVRELMHLIEDSETEIMVTLDLRLIYPNVAAMLGKTPLKRIVVCRMAGILPFLKGLLFPIVKHGEVADIPNDDRHQTFDTLIDNDGRFQPVAIDPTQDLAVLQYTGGTTGVPKGAMLTHANLVANMVQIQRWFPGVAPGQERMLAVLPFFHVFAMTVVMNFGVACGAEIILLPRFDMTQFLETVHKRRPTLFPGVPTLYKAIAGNPDLKKYDLSSIQYCISGGAPLPVEVKAEFEALTGCILVEGYGLSESSPVATANPLSGLNKAGSPGLPVPGTLVEIRSIDGERRLLPPGEKGEVCIRGPQVMKGYWKRPADTAQTIIDGALHTGDIGYLDDQGYLFLVDRIKDVILCGGYNVYPRMIEEAIYLHPAVAAVTVIAIPDDYRGQAPKAFIQVKDGETLTAGQLTDFLGDKISRIEMPRHIEFRAELPKTAVGKLSKKELVAEETAKREAADEGHT